MLTNKPTSIIHTDRWNLNPTAAARVLLIQTVEVSLGVCRHLMGILLTHWPSLGGLSTQKRVLAVEKLIHQTAKNPNPKYRQSDQTFYKFPSYYRRAAIVFALWPSQ
ncbi:MAG: transposase [Limnospira maxima]|nr:transposase [Arthrospira sp. O9.13F]